MPGDNCTELTVENYSDHNRNLNDKAAEEAFWVTEPEKPLSPFISKSENKYLKKFNSLVQKVLGDINTSLDSFVYKINEYINIENKVRDINFNNVIPGADPINLLRAILFIQIPIQSYPLLIQA